jgi:hypothetical protein
MIAKSQECPHPSLPFCPPWMPLTAHDAARALPRRIRPLHPISVRLSSVATVFSSASFSKNLVKDAQTSSTLDSLGETKTISFSTPTAILLRAGLTIP